MVMDYMPGNTENLDKTDTVKSKNFIVLYFDQRMNAWVCMVVNNEKRLKIFKKVPFSSCAREAHIRPM